MNKCSECKHENDYIPCDTCIHSPDIKDRFEPLTNADRIRGMSDEEMARFLDEISGFQADYLKYKGKAIDAVHLIDWLRQPAETEGKE